MNSKPKTKQQLKLEQIERLRSALKHASETGGAPLIVAEAASQTDIDRKVTLQLLSGKPLKDEVVLVAKEAAAPVLLQEDLSRLGTGDRVLNYFIERVKAARLTGVAAQRQDLAAFLKEAKVPTALKPLITSELKQRLANATLSDNLLEVIEPPLTTEAIADSLIETMVEARHEAHYPVLRSVLAATKSIRASTAQITAAMKHPRFVDQVAECSIIGSTAAKLSYVLASDVDGAAPRLVVLAIEGAIENSRIATAKKASRPSTVFAAKKLAAALLKKKPLQERFIAALERQADDAALDDELGTLLLDGAKMFFRLADVEPRLSTQPVREQPVREQPVRDRPAIDVPPQPLTESNNTEFFTAFDLAFEQLDSRYGGRNDVKLVELREALPSFTRIQFDAGLRHLRLAGRYAMDSAHGGSVTLSDAERAAGIQEGNSLMIYVSRR